MPRVLVYVGVLLVGSSAFAHLTSKKGAFTFEIFRNLIRVVLHCSGEKKNRGAAARTAAAV
jgi:hypothetical protein